MSLLRSMLRRVARLGGALPHLRLAARESATRSLGWNRSVQQDAPVDAAGNPVPWMTYPCIRFLGDRLRRDLRVFEFGCGGSTSWFAARTAHVTTLEHDQTWAERIRPGLPGNTSLQCVPVPYSRPYGELAFGDVTERGAYIEMIAAAGGPWDVVVIDGILRNACIVAATSCLSSRGVVVLDNSDYPELAPGVEHLRALSFRQIPFQGMAPVQSLLSETSVFYRPDNCLSI